MTLDHALRPFAPAIRRMAALSRAESGIAAIEFALAVPVLATLFFGVSETLPAVIVDRKLATLTRSIADLSSRDASITTTQLSTVWGAAAAVMRPYDSTATQMVVSSILITKTGSTYTGAVDWSCGKNLKTKAGNQTQADFDANNLSIRAQGSSYAVPPGFQTTGQNGTTQSFILAETLQPYTSALGATIVGTIPLREKIAWPARANQVTGPGTCPT